MNIAVIDIGSNSLRMQISKIEKGTFEVIEDFKDMLKLGDDVFKLGYISKKSTDILIERLKEIKTICSSKSVATIRAVATASFREANNAKDVTDEIEKNVGLKIEVIDGAFEAYLGFLGVSSNFDISNSKVLIMDMGGGSTEFVVAKNGKMLFSKSTPYGCNKLFHKYFSKNNPAKEEDITLFKEEIEYALNDLPIERTLEHVICLGGTLNNVAFIRNRQNYGKKINYVDRKFLKNFIRKISHKTIEEQEHIKGLEPKRAGIVLPATLLIDKVLDASGASGFYALSGGLRDGLTIDTINKMGIILNFQKQYYSLRISRIMDIGNKFNFEKKHAVHVNSIALSIFEQTEGLHNLGKKERKILELSALLHDVGNYISYSKHHKHSYYLILNSDFIGYSSEDIEIASNVARYHRKSLPKKTHENFMKLDEKNQRTVKILAGILRIADALDRTHESKIEKVNITINNNSVIFNIKSKKNILAEKRAFDRKKNLFENIFKKKAELVL